MAMSSNVLAADIKARVASKNADFASKIGDDLDWLFEAMAEAVISHIQTYATVATTVTVTSVSGVTVGAGVSGPGTGSGSGSIT